METLNSKEKITLKARLTRASAQAVRLLVELESICDKLDASINYMMRQKSKMLFSKSDDSIYDFMDEQINYNKLLAERAYKHEELQAAVAELSGYAALAIEQYILTKDNSIKMSYRSATKNFTDALGSNGLKLQFPAAKAILAPFLLRAEVSDKPDFATFRVYIRRLCSM